MSSLQDKLIETLRVHPVLNKGICGAVLASWGFTGATGGKENSPANTGDVRETVLSLRGEDALEE